MYINHLYYHSSSAITHTLTHILANAVKHADVRAYLFFSADREAEFEETAARISGKVVWVHSVATGPMGFLAERAFIGLIEFNVPAGGAGAVSAFFEESGIAEKDGQVLLVKDPASPENLRDILLREYTPHDERANTNFSSVDALMNAGTALLYYRDLAGAAYDSDSGETLSCCEVFVDAAWEHLVPEPPQDATTHEGSFDTAAGEVKFTVIEHL